MSDPLRPRREDSKCTPEIVDALCQALRTGREGKAMALTQACEAVGIHRSITFDWRDRGAKGDAECAAAWQRIQEARQALPAELLGRMFELAERGGPGDNTRLGALRWLLEKLHPEDFDAPKQVELSGKGGKPISHEHALVDPVALCQRIAALRAGGAVGPGAADGPGGTESGGAPGDRGGDGGG